MLICGRVPVLDSDICDCDMGSKLLLGPSTRSKVLSPGGPWIIWAWSVSGNHRGEQEQIPGGVGRRFQDVGATGVAEVEFVGKDC